MKPYRPPSLAEICAECNHNKAAHTITERIPIPTGDVVLRYPETFLVPICLGNGEFFCTCKEFQP